MGMRVLFYLVFYPMSLLPLWVLYGIAYIFYLIVNYIIRYRRHIITQNLKRAFPEKSEREIDLSPCIFECARLSYCGHTSMRLLVAAGSEENIKPEQVLSHFFKTLGSEYDDASYQIVRQDVYFKGEDGMLLPLSEAGSDIP